MDAESGLLVFKILEGQLAHTNSYLEVVMDDNLFPCYTSSKARSQAFTFNETADAMVRELDLSRITLRLVSEVNSKGEEKAEQIKAKITGQTLDTLKRCLYTPTQIALKDAHGHESKITVSMRFLPVKMHLDPSESFNNSGILRVDVVDAADLPAMDRNGYSDPYCKFKLDGKDIYKTKTQKKTLHPAWNEFFEVPVRSRTGAKFEVTVYDWDFGDKADLLGAAVIDLKVLEPFQQQEVKLPLDGKSGIIRLNLVFKPDYVTRSRQGSSTFSGTFATPGKVIGAPVKGVGKGAVFVGGGMAKGAGFLGRGFKRRTVSGQVVGGASDEEANGTLADTRDTSMDAQTPPATANGHAPQSSIDGIAGKDSPATPHQRVRSFGGVSQSPAGGAESGTATISVIGASGFEGEPKLEVHVAQDTSKGSKEVIKTGHHKAKGGEVKFEGETKKVPCNADTQFRVEVREHKTFSSEKLGEAAFFINDQAAGGQRVLKVGSGTVVLQTSFLAADMGSIMGGPDSPASRKGGGPSGLGRFMSRRDQRSVTPSG